MPLSKSIEREGCILHYEIAGGGSNVLLIQGVGVQGACWRPQTDVLQASHQCLWFDNRGMGQSQPAGSSLTVEQMAADALAVLDAAGCDNAHLVGHSLGGLIAMEIACSARDRVRSLSLLCTFPNGRSAAPMTPRMMWAGMRSQIGTRSMRRRGFLSLVLSPDERRQSDLDQLSIKLADLFGHDLGEQPPVVKTQLKALRQYNPPSLAAIAGIPTLVMSGLYDPIAPPQAGRALANAIPGSTYIEFPNASHGLPIQHAASVNTILLKHLKEADRR